MTKRKGNRWMRISFLLIILGSLALGAYLLYPWISLYLASKENNMAIGPDEKAVVFIPTGSDTKDVQELLISGGVITDGEVFFDLAVQKNYMSQHVVPGKYELHGKMTNNDLINHLRAGNGRLEVEVTFNNVHTIEELAEKITSTIELKKDDMLKLLQSDSLLGKYGFNKQTIFCLFIPDTYRMDWAIRAQELFNRISAEYRTFWTPARKEKAKELGLSQSQVATLASIVMMEQGKHPEEWPAIAGLYINRLQKGMKLESDPTVKYALGDMTIRRVLNKHLEVESPYNTYRNKGLPPGPIVMPTKQAMDAVLNHEKHEYIFMCAKPEYSGLHNFATNYNQHRRFAKAYREWLNREGIR